MGQSYKRGAEKNRSYSIEIGKVGGIKAKSSQYRELLFFDKLYDIFYSAIQGVTQSVQCLGADRLPFLDTIKGVGGKALFIYQVIFRNVFLEESFVKGRIADHSHHHG